mmetsp:Transcript_63687/g.177126  ORF Transcript_63687/g.177126 Transcript_63687/m.177126 type:complete len:677 (-) Transcript_63687:3383-5413(-)
MQMSASPGETLRTTLHDLMSKTSVIAIAERHTKRSVLNEADVTPAESRSVIHPSALSVLAAACSKSSAAGASTRGPSRSSKTSSCCKARTSGDDTSKLVCNETASPTAMNGFSDFLRKGVPWLPFMETQPVTPSRRALPRTRATCVSVSSCGPSMTSNTSPGSSLRSVVDAPISKESVIAIGLAHVQKSCTAFAKLVLFMPAPCGTKALNARANCSLAMPCPGCFSTNVLNWAAVIWSLPQATTAKSSSDVLPAVCAAALSAARAWFAAAFDICSRAPRNASVAAWHLRSAAEARDVNFVSWTRGSRRKLRLTPRWASRRPEACATTAFASVKAFTAASASLFKLSSCAVVTLSALEAFDFSTTFADFASAASTASVASFTAFVAMSLHLLSNTSSNSCLRFCVTDTLAAKTSFLSCSIFADSWPSFTRASTSFAFTSARGPCFTLETSTVFWSTASMSSVDLASTPLTHASRLSTRPATIEERLKFDVPALSSVTHTVLPSFARTHRARTPSATDFCSKTSTPSPTSTVPSSFPPSSASVASVATAQTRRSLSNALRPSSDNVLPPATTENTAFASGSAKFTLSLPESSGSFPKKSMNCSALADFAPPLTFAKRLSALTRSLLTYAWSASMSACLRRACKNSEWSLDNRRALALVANSKSNCNFFNPSSAFRNSF